MKHMKKILAMALVAISILAVAIPAIAAYRPWQDEWNPHTLYPETYPPVGSTLRQQIANFQNALNNLRTMYAGLGTPGSQHYYPALTVDGKYGARTTEAVRQVQRYLPGLSVDGAAGVQTKNAIWNALGRQPYAD